MEFESGAAGGGHDRRHDAVGAVGAVCGACHLQATAVCVCAVTSGAGHANRTGDAAQRTQGGQRASVRSQPPHGPFSHTHRPTGTRGVVLVKQCSPWRLLHCPLCECVQARLDSHAGQGRGVGRGDREARAERGRADGLAWWLLCANASLLAQTPWLAECVIVRGVAVTAPSRFILMAERACHRATPSTGAFMREIRAILRSALSLSPGLILAVQVGWSLSRCRECRPECSANACFWLVPLRLYSGKLARSELA